MAHRQPKRTETAPAETGSEFITVADVCEILGQAPQTVRIKIAEGHLPAYRIKGSRGIRVKRSDVEALLEPIPTVGGISA